LVENSYFFDPLGVCGYGTFEDRWQAGHFGAAILLNRVGFRHHFCGFLAINSVRKIDLKNFLIFNE
jgi:hypothetical protein